MRRNEPLNTNAEKTSALAELSFVTSHPADPPGREECTGNSVKNATKSAGEAGTASPPELHVIRIFLAPTDPLESAEVFACGLAAVSPQRRQEILRLRSAEERLRSLGAALLLRQAVKGLGIDPFPPLSKGPAGKPFFPSLPHLHFNLSHSGERIMCVLSPVPVGCDVQAVGSLPVRVLNRCFAPPERAFVLAGATGKEQERRFARLWTLKESYIKATGEGFTLPWERFFVEMPLPSPSSEGSAVSADRTAGGIALWRDGRRQPCRLYELSPEKGYCYALCHMGETLPLSVQTVTLVPPEPQDNTEKP